MAINKKLIHFKNKEKFEEELANNNILDSSIVFIQDSKEISTHGTVYKTVNWSVLDGPELITFTITSHNGVYQCEKGMTWAEFIDSDYNTYGFRKSGIYVVSPLGYSLNALDEIIHEGSYKFEK